MDDKRLTWESSPFCADERRGTPWRGAASGGARRAGGSAVSDELTDLRLFPLVPGWRPVLLAHVARPLVTAGGGGPRRTRGQTKTPSRPPGTKERSLSWFHPPFSSNALTYGEASLAHVWPITEPPQPPGATCTVIARGCADGWYSRGARAVEWLSAGGHSSLSGAPRYSSRVCRSLALLSSVYHARRETRKPSAAQVRLASATGGARATLEWRPPLSGNLCRSFAAEIALES